MRCILQCDCMCALIIWAMQCIEVGVLVKINSSGEICVLVSMRACIFGLVCVQIQPSQKMQRLLKPTRPYEYTHACMHACIHAQAYMHTIQASLLVKDACFYIDFTFICVCMQVKARMYLHVCMYM